MSEWGRCGEADFVIVAEDATTLEEAHEIFAELDAATPGMRCWRGPRRDLSITEIGEITLRPDKVVGFRWFAGKRLVEVVEGDDTSAETGSAR